MPGFPTTNFERTKLSFSLEGLNSREEVLFKSFVRLLDHVNDQKWIYRPALSDYRTDLLIVAEGYLPTRYRHPYPVAQPVMTVGGGDARAMHMTWPIQPNKLNAALNRIGSEAVQHQAMSSGAMFVPAQQTGSGNGSGIGNADGDAVLLFRLKQWPPSKFLVGTGRMRLATLLSGRAMSLVELQHRSALPLAVCRAFTTDLQSDNLVVISVQEVIARPAQPASPHELLNLPSAAVAFAKQGLFARIRSGLGIKSSHNA